MLNRFFLSLSFFLLLSVKKLLLLGNKLTRSLLRHDSRRFSKTFIYINNKKKRKKQTKFQKKLR